MARNWFGGGPGLRTSDCYLVDETGARVPDAPVVVKDAATGIVLTDLLDENGVASTSVSSGELGYLTFATEDVPVVDVTAGDGTFRFVSSTAVEEVVGLADNIDGLAASATASAAASTASAASATASETAAELAASLVGAPVDSVVAGLFANPASLVSTAERARQNATYDRIGPKVYHLDVYNQFFLNAGAWVVTQPGGDTTTTLTAQATAGASVMAVTAGTMAPNGTSLVTNAGTATQQIYQVTAGGGTTSLTVTPNIVTTLANGATIATLWTNASHLTALGYAAYAYWIVNSQDDNNALILQDPGTRPVVFLGDSWFTNIAATAPARVAALYPSATVTMAGVSGNTSAQMIARFATDVPTNAAYVFFNEPGVNDIYGAVATAAPLETLVRLIRDIGAVPIFTGSPPLQEKPLAPAVAEALLAQVGDGWGFGIQASQVAALFPAATIPAAIDVTTSLGVGYRALEVNAAGTGSTAFGASALYNSTGNDNSALGNLALNFATGARNTALGHQAGYNLTTTNESVAVGDLCMFSGAAGGGQNVGVGASALYGCLTGQNVAAGFQALFSACGAVNTAIGYQALRSATGDTNVAIGGSAGYKPNNVTANATTSGSSQTLVGYQTGQASTTQVSYITALGYRARVTAAGGVAIGTDSGGAGALSTAANEIALGTANHLTTILGRLVTAVGTTAKAGVNVPHGAAPTSPVNGDLWTTTAGLYVRINGATVGPLT